MPASGIAIHGHSFPDREVPEELALDFTNVVPGCFNVGLPHTSLAGANGHDSYAPTSLSVMKSRGYDYLALGHVHARRALSLSLAQALRDTPTA